MMAKKQVPPYCMIHDTVSYVRYSRRRKLAKVTQRLSTSQVYCIYKTYIYENANFSFLISHTNTSATVLHLAFSVCSFLYF